MSPTTQPVYGAPNEFGVREHSINAALTMLFPAIPLFIEYRSPSRFDRLGPHLGLMRAPTEPLMLDRVANPLEAHCPRAKEQVLADDFPSTLTANP